MYLIVRIGTKVLPTNLLILKDVWVLEAVDKLDKLYYDDYSSWKTEKLEMLPQHLIEISCSKKITNKLLDSVI